MRLRSVLYLFVVLPATAAFATTFVVPTDGQMIRRSDAIVVATAMYSFARPTSDGGVETVTTVAVEEVVKGGYVGPTLDVVEPGGSLSDVSVEIAGVPRFENGRRMLLFLVRGPARQWCVAELVLGKFTFLPSETRQGLLARDADEIVGWDPDLKRHRERIRVASPFLEFIRAESRGHPGQSNYFLEQELSKTDLTNTLGRRSASLFGADPLGAVNEGAYSPSSYTMIVSGSLGARWTALPNAVVFYTGTTQESGAPGGGASAVQAGIFAWDSDPASNVNYSYGGTDNGSHTQGLHAVDGANTVLFERDLSAWGVSPFTCSSGGFSGTLGIGGVTSATGTHTFSGETFYTTQEGDVEMNRGIANCSLLFNSGDFNTAVAHELGHTLGLRHSDQNRSLSGSCSTDPSLDCSTLAVMKAFISTGINASLQQWDRNAAQALYPNPPASTKVLYDLNGDRTTDILWRNLNTGEHSAWFMRGATPAGGATPPQVGLDWQPFIGDFNNDQNGDIFWRNTRTGENAMWLMRSGQFFSGGTPPPVAVTWSPFIADFNGDGMSDILWRNRSSGEHSLWLMNGASPNGGGTPPPVATNWTPSTADFDADGKADIFWRNSSTGENAIWFMNGAAISGGGTPPPVAGVWRPFFGDFNGNGTADILWRNGSTGEHSMWLMNGASTAGGGTPPPVSSDWTPFIGDFDGDGRADIWWRNTGRGENALWFMNGPTITGGGTPPPVPGQWSIVR